MPELVELADYYKTDKGTLIGHAHNYAALYSFLFEQFRDQAFSMLEIGLERGGAETGSSVDRIGADVPSIRMWLDYFQHAKLYGFDLSDFSHIRMDRFEFHRGDLGSIPDLDHLSAALPSLKLLINDGSHASFHQLLAFLKLFDKVEPGGFYVIEDFHWQPPSENSLQPCRKSAEVFEIFLKTGKLDIPFAHPDYLSMIAAQIQQVYVHRNNRDGINNWQFKMVALQKRL